MLVVVGSRAPALRRYPAKLLTAGLVAVTIPAAAALFGRARRAVPADHGIRVTIPAFPRIVKGTVGGVPRQIISRNPGRAVTIVIPTTSYAGALAGGVRSVFSPVTSTGRGGVTVRPRLNSRTRTAVSAPS